MVELCFNRTIVGLKQMKLRRIDQERLSFNRTIVGLKHLKTLK